MILDDEELTSQWNEELTEMRDRINGLRRELVSKLQDKGVAKDFHSYRMKKDCFRSWVSPRNRSAR